MRGLTGDWLVSRQRFFGVPFPVWYPLDAGRRARSRRSRCCRPRTACRWTPRRTRPAGYAEAQRGPARRLRRRPGRDGHLGHLVADAADRRRLGTTTRTCSPASSRTTCGRRRTRSSAPGCSPTVLRAHTEHGRAAVARRAISGWILDPDRKKMSKSTGNVATPDGPAGQYGVGRGALLGGAGAAGVRHRVRRGADAGRPAAGDEAAQRVAGSCSACRRRRTRTPPHRAGGPRAARPAGRLWSTPRPRPSTATTTPRALAGAEGSLVVLRRPHGAGQVPGVRRRRSGRRRLGSRGAAHRAVRAAAAVRPGAAVRHRGGVVLVADGSVHRAAWPDPAPLRAPPAGWTRGCPSWRPGCSARCAGRRAPRTCRCGRRWTGCGCWPTS